MQLFLIDNGQPINMNSDYRGIIVLEEHIDEVSLCPLPPATRQPFHLRMPQGPRVCLLMRLRSMRSQPQTAGN